MPAPVIPPLAAVVDVEELDALDDVALAFVVATVPAELEPASPSNDGFSSRQDAHSSAHAAHITRSTDTV